MERYKRLLTIRIIWWWAWWVILLMAVVGWTIDLSTGMHPFPAIPLVLSALGATVLISKLPTKKLLIQKDLKREKTSKLAEIYILEQKTLNKRRAEKKKEQERNLNNYKAKLENELNSERKKQ